MRWNSRRSIRFRRSCRAASATCGGLGQLPTRRHREERDGTHGCACRSKKRSDDDGGAERGEPAGPSGQPLLQPLEIHHFPVSGFLVPHREQGIEPPPLRRFIDVLPDGEDAMVEAIRFADDREPVLVDRAVSCPPVPVQIEHRRGRRLAALQAVERIALATDVIAVLADEDVEAPDRQVGRRIQALAP